MKSSKYTVRDNLVSNHASELEDGESSKSDGEILLVVADKY